MRSLRECITVLVKSQQNRANVLHISGSKPRKFQGSFFITKRFVFPPETSTANKDSLFDNHAGSFSRKIWEEKLKSRFLVEPYFTENLIWTLRRMFRQPRQFFSEIPKNVLCKVWNSFQIIYCFKKSIFPGKLLWRKELQFSRRCRLFLPQPWRNYCFSFSLKKLSPLKTCSGHMEFSVENCIKRYCMESIFRSFTTWKTYWGKYCFKNIGFPQKNIEWSFDKRAKNDKICKIGFFENLFPSKTASAHTECSFDKRAVKSRQCPKIFCWKHKNISKQPLSSKNFVCLQKLSLDP